MSLSYIATLLMGLTISCVTTARDIPGKYCYQCYNIDETETCTNIAPCESDCITECFMENNLITRHHFCEDDAPCGSGNGRAKSIGKGTCNETLCNTQTDCNVTCEVCNGPTCGETTGTIATCPGDQNNCLTHIKVDSTKEVTKRCASYADCNRLWWKGTSDKDECTKNTTSTFAKRDCTYCCTESNCNAHAFFDMPAIFQGTF